MGRKSLKLEGEQFNNFRVVEKLPQTVVGKINWLCSCICGANFSATTKQITRLKNLSCGCKDRLKAIDVQVGSKYNRFTVIGIPFHTEAGYIEAKCQCDCGTIKNVNVSNLLAGKSKSCGCLSVERVTTHGQSRSLTHNSYWAMLGRCCNINHVAYPLYGGIGVEVCDRWLESFENFFEDMGERTSKELTLDRIDGSLGYSPENCRWASKSLQAINQKKSSANTSGRTGVYWYKSRNRWVVRLMKDGVDHWIGQYTDFNEACNAASEGEVRLFGFSRDNYQEVIQNET